MPHSDGLRRALRSGTALSHQRLEAELALLSPPLKRERFLQVLQRFHGFHVAWEPALAAWLPSRFCAARSKLAALQADLAAMGLGPAAIGALPVCVESVTMCASVPAALGALYVMEGSTLGGKLITARLRDAPWLPAAGLRYFDPYGGRSGVLWKETLAMLARSPQADGPAIVQSAALTFDLLRRWLTADAAAPHAEVCAGRREPSAG